jgi:putative transposase
VPCIYSEPSMDNVPRKKLHHINIPGHAHELTFSCYRRLPLLARNMPCRWLIDAMDAARKKHHCSLLAYVIMPEHVHIIIYPQEVHHDMAWFLKSIKQSVSRKAHTWLAKQDQLWLERLTVSGEDKFRFWQAGGGYDRNIEKHAILIQMIEYIHLNPVRRGLVKAASDWLWSSASWYEGKESVIPMDSIR